MTVPRIDSQQYFIDSNRLTRIFERSTRGAKIRINNNNQHVIDVETENDMCIKVGYENPTDDAKKQEQQDKLIGVITIFTLARSVKLSRSITFFLSFQRPTSPHPRDCDC
jgi:Tfp pilus assembly PilM family ATPase